MFTQKVMFKPLVFCAEIVKLGGLMNAEGRNGNSMQVKVAMTNPKFHGGSALRFVGYYFFDH